MGLLLLRATAGATSLVQALLALSGGSPTLPIYLAGGLGLLAGAMLIVGLMTPLAAALFGFAAVGMATVALPLVGTNLFDSLFPTLLAVAIAAAVALLGPGALSVDALLFGRREIIIPRSQSPKL
jgi:uncharacterized membrane protein YphA (DoxX/SURF4 family)